VLHVDQDHTVIIDLNQNIWGFDSNKDRQFALNDIISIFVPKQILNSPIKHISCGYYHTIVIDLQDHMWTFGYGINGQCSTNQITVQRNYIISLSQIHGLKVKNISCGKFHTMWIGSD
jgi:alpha-tubulin suppressor-like RCC1 family protein